MSLSEEILVEILCCCDAPVVSNACRTDRLLRRVGREERIWRSICMHHWTKTRVHHLPGSSRSGIKKIWAIPPPPPPFKSVASIWSLSKKSPNVTDIASTYWRDLFQREMAIQRLEGVYEQQTPLEADPAAPSPNSKSAAKARVTLFLLSWNNSHVLEELNPDGDCAELGCLHCGPARRPNSAPAPMDMGTGSFAIRQSVSLGNKSLISVKIGTFSVALSDQNRVVLLCRERFRRASLRGIGSSTTEEPVDVSYELEATAPENGSLEMASIALEGRVYSKTPLHEWVDAQLEKLEPSEEHYL
eukprot:TRINITY_DN8561_c0_g1_i1.p1 TRINITY_DN8561_c0_g1~~TRINITY_DN8561_c0_g1_i1.p1  ORF type:complete len:302 (-),score=48.52 TRINITY_DN8561_c0_g1_i1:290-1195(-)